MSFSKKYIRDIAKIMQKRVKNGLRYQVLVYYNEELIIINDLDSLDRFLEINPDAKVVADWGYKYNPFLDKLPTLKSIEEDIENFIAGSKINKGGKLI